VVNGWFWGQLQTGSGQYLHQMVEALPQVAPEHRYTLVLPAAADRGLALPASWRVEVVATPENRVGGNMAKVWFEQVGFPRACRRLEASVAFVPYWGSPWHRPCRLAVTVHDLIPLLLPAYRGGMAQQLYTGLVSRTARRADVVLTDSQASRRDVLAHLGIAAGRVQAVPLAGGGQFRPVEDAQELARVQERYGLPDGQAGGRFVLYLGGFDARKNVPRLVRAYGMLLRQAGHAADTPRLVIAGQLPARDTPFTPDPRRVVAEEGIGEWVHFTGWVVEADKPALYSLAALFAFPSLYEGFGLPVAEAAACGVPVVTSDRSSLPEAAAGAILVDPEDQAALAAALAAGLQRGPPRAEAPRRTWLDVARASAAVIFGE
jgi:glycosyltransferase involved in cell wall biosynthesis